METFLIISSILSVLASVAAGTLQGFQDKDNLREAQQYNSVPNQVQQYKDAGLNPNLAAGGFVPVGTNVSNVQSPAALAMRGLSSSISDVMNVYGKNEQRDISAMNAETNRTNADTNRLKAWIENQKFQLFKKQAKQALRNGDLNYAMQMLNYDYLSSTQDSRIKKAVYDSNILGNKSFMSDYEAKTYSDYRDAIIDDVVARANRNVYLNSRDSQKLANDLMLGKAGLRLKSQKLLDDRNYRNSLLDFRDEVQAERDADDRRDYITDLIEKGIDIGLTVGTRGRRRPYHRTRLFPNRK